MNLPATQIDLDAEISVSELRSEELFDRRLQAHSALRLRIETIFWELSSQPSAESRSRKRSAT